jgi:hypothetical protein
VVCAVVLASSEVHDARRWAIAASSLRAASPPFDFPLASLPITPASTDIAYALLVAGCALGLVGLLSRTSLVIATLAASYLLGIPQLVGSVTHDHHLVWFLAVLAASPCADALSFDAWRRARAGRPAPPVRALAYGVPIWTARCLVALIFFFPGLWKLRESGWAWIASDNLRNQMYFKWYEFQWVPWLRIDRAPLACRALAFAAVAFEITFPFAIWHRRTRPCAAVVALAFHAGTQELMGIRFTALWLTYVMFFDAWYWVRRTGLPARWYTVSRNAVTRGPPPHARASIVVGALLLAANATYGWLGRFQAWPFACYPTFQWIVGDAIPHLAIDALAPDGTATPVSHRPRSQKEWGVEWTLVGAVRGRTSEERLRAWWSSAAASNERRDARAHGAARVRFYRAESSVIPERWPEPPLRRVPIAELALEP